MGHVAGLSKVAPPVAHLTSNLPSEFTPGSAGFRVNPVGHSYTATPYSFSVAGFVVEGSKLVSGTPRVAVQATGVRHVPVGIVGVPSALQVDMKWVSVSDTIVLSLHLK